MIGKWSQRKKVVYPHLFLECQKQTREIIEILPRHHPMTWEDEAELIGEIQAGDHRRREWFLLNHSRLVLRMARTVFVTQVTGIQLWELFEGGVTGLIRALDKADVTRKNRFCHYASKIIYEEIMKAVIRETGYGIPEWVVTAQWNRSFKMETRQKLINALSTRNLTDEEIDHFGEKDDERVSAASEAREALCLLEAKNPLWARVVREYYGIDGPALLFREIREGMNASRNGPCQMHAKALEFLRERWTGETG